MTERYRQITIGEFIGNLRPCENVGPIVQRQIEAKKEAIDQVLEIVAYTYCLEVEEIKGPSRKKDIARARHMAGYLLYNQVGLSFRASALSLGRNDHTTVSNSVERINGLLKTNPDFEDKMKTALSALSGFRS